jgi:hypothetical protein
MAAHRVSPYPNSRFHRNSLPQLPEKPREDLEPDGRPEPMSEVDYDCDWCGCPTGEIVHHIVLCRACNPEWPSMRRRMFCWERS